MTYKKLTLRCLKEPTRENAEIDLSYIRLLLADSDVFILVSDNKRSNTSLFGSKIFRLCRVELTIDDPIQFRFTVDDKRSYFLMTVRCLLKDFDRFKIVYKDKK